MKRLATLILFSTLSFAAYAETILICHAQSVPVALGKTFQSPLSTALVDGVFAYFFAKGDITFDAPFSLSEGVPSSGWLAGLSGRYGADKVVYVQVIWKQGPDDEAVLDRVDYQLIAPQGKVLAEGSLQENLISPSKDEGKLVKAVTARVVAGLSS